MQFVVAFALLWLHTAFCRETNAPCGYGYKCFPYRIISQLDGFEIRSYDQTTWITWEEHGGITDLTDFPFLVEYTDRKLATYFAGQNYAEEVLERTTPLKIDVQLFDLHRPRRVSYPVHVAPEDGIPAPLHPLFISRVAERYVYVRRVSSKLPYLDLLHAAAEFMADLAMRKEPFDKESVNFVLYSSPGAQAEEDAKTFVDNEIWIGRTLQQSLGFGGGYGGAYSGGFGGGGGFGGSDHGHGHVGNNGGIFSDDGSFDGYGASGWGRVSRRNHGYGVSGFVRPYGRRGVIKMLTEKRKE